MALSLFGITGPTAYFGMTTKLADLVTVLEADEIAGAALDVYEQEPLPRDNRLWSLPNVLVTPPDDCTTMSLPKAACAA